MDSDQSLAVYLLTCACCSLFMLFILYTFTKPAVVPFLQNQSLGIWHARLNTSYMESIMTVLTTHHFIFSGSLQ